MLLPARHGCWRTRYNLFVMSSESRGPDWTWRVNDAPRMPGDLWTQENKTSIIVTTHNYIAPTTSSEGGRAAEPVHNPALNKVNQKGWTRRTGTEQRKRSRISAVGGWLARRLQVNMGWSRPGEWNQQVGGGCCINQTPAQVQTTVGSIRGNQTLSVSEQWRPCL